MIYRPGLTPQLAGPTRWRWLDCSASEDLKPLPAPKHPLAAAINPDLRIAGRARVEWITYFRHVIDNNLTIMATYPGPRATAVFARLPMQTERSPQYPRSEQDHHRATSLAQHLTIPPEMIE